MKKESNNEALSIIFGDLHSGLLRGNKNCLAMKIFDVKISCFGFTVQFQSFR